MKNTILCHTLLLLALAGLGAETQAQDAPQPQPAQAVDAPKSQTPSVPVTSVSEFKDVKPDARYFAALQNLTERYGVMEAYPDSTFRGEAPLTREQFAVIVNTGLERLGELAAVAGEGNDIGSIADYFNAYDANDTKITSLSQIKDVPATAERFRDLESLVERYGIVLADKDKNFRPQQAVTQKEFSGWITGIFGATDDGKPSATQPITRGDAIMVFVAAFDNVNEMIGLEADKMKDAKKE